MPTTVIEGYKFRFYSPDRFEPPHMHAIHGEKVAKVWLTPVEVESDCAACGSEPWTVVADMA